MSRQPAGTVYLIHFDQAIADHARHYLGWASDLAARLEAHRAGRGARLMEVCKDRGITWHVSRTWEGTRERERAIKDRAESPRLCPDCTPAPRPVAKGRSASPAAKTPVPEPDLPWPWPGRPGLEAEASGYAGYEGLTDALISQWQAEAAGAALEVPAPRRPEPEIQAPEPEMEMEL